jgi:hypothetical protein
VNVDAFMPLLASLESTAYTCVNVSPSNEYLQLYPQTLTARRRWHHGKCTEPEYNTWNYTGTYRAVYCLGATGYVIGSNALAILESFFLNSFTDKVRAFEIYEDKLVGEVLHDAGLLGKQFDAGSTLPMKSGFNPYHICRYYHMLVTGKLFGSTMRTIVYAQLMADPISAASYTRISGETDKVEYMRQFTTAYLKRGCMTLIDPRSDADVSFLQWIIHAKRIGLRGQHSHEAEAVMQTRAQTMLGRWLKTVPAPRFATTSPLKPPSPDDIDDGEGGAR